MSFDLILGISGSAVGAGLSLVASYLSSKLSEQRKKQQKKIIRNAEKIYSEAQSELLNSLSISTDDLPKVSKDKFIEYLMNHQKNDGSFETSPIIFPPSVTKEDVQNEIDERISSIKDKINTIEKRFPSRDTIDKVASVNDAILATNLEALSNSVRKLEDQILSKWDIAKIVFQIVAALGGLLGLSLTIIKFVIVKSVN